jgi:DtxR family Mn-dependent transcriptional regulator
MNSLTEENYLKAIFHLIDDEQNVTINELSKFLGIKMPSVNSMIKKFSQKNWVIYESYKPIKITDKGRIEAARVVRKHRLTEMFLVDKMGFGWENVHEIAEQLEHIQSEIFLIKWMRFSIILKLTLMANQFLIKMEISLIKILVN